MTERVEKLKKTVSDNPDSLKKVGEDIDSNLEEIKKYLEASEVIIKREADELPKTKTSYDNLTKSVTELEEEVKKLETQYKALETKSNNAKANYLAGGALAGIVAAVAVWASISGVKKWLGREGN